MKQTSSSNEIQELAELLTLLMQNVAMVTDLQAENNTLKNIIEMLPGNVYWKNIEGKFLGCNKNMVEVAGLESADNIIGNSVTQLFGEEIGKPIEQIDNKVMLEGKEHTFEESGVTKDNQPAV